MNQPLLSIIIPTIGRPTIVALLRSIPDSQETEIIVIADGWENPPRASIGRPHKIMKTTPRLGHFGYPARNLGLAAATGRWVCFADDDDYYAPGGVEAMLDYCRIGELPAVFRMRRDSFGDTLPRDQVMRCGNIGLPQFVCRNISGLPKFKTHYEADFDWMNYIASQSGGIAWGEAVTYIAPAPNHGK